MPLALVRSRAPSSALAPEVTVEVHLANGLPSFQIVGLPDLEVRESRERVRAALDNCGFDFPVRRITVNLAPADLPKESGRFDLPIALGILAASGQLPDKALQHREFAGELSLTGALRPMRGAFAMACGAARQRDAAPLECTGPRNPEIYLPADNAREAALAPGVVVYGAADLVTLVAHLRGLPDAQLQPARVCAAALPAADALPDMGDVIGQPVARRALEVAAAGAHHMLMVGPPGAGKSMLAARLAGILPPMTDDEALQSASILSTSAGDFTPSQWRRRPFRAPHHSASAAALVGGRNPPRPGEITLAHLGVLFLDELPEFDRHVLETLREPLETGRITISRAAAQSEFAAGCQLIAAMNPCPCGFRGDPRGRCRCTPDAAQRYRQKLSGPLLDRIDILIDVPALSPAELVNRGTARGEPSSAVAPRVAAARERQLGRQGRPNRALHGAELDEWCAPDAEGRQLLQSAGERFGWSARAFESVLRVARTIADLAGALTVSATHVAEAAQYRRALGMD